LVVLPALHWCTSAAHAKLKQLLVQQSLSWVQSPPVATHWSAPTPPLPPPLCAFRFRRFSFRRFRRCCLVRR